MLCELCPRKCGKERNKVLANGFCQMNDVLKIAHYELFMFEEPCISFKNGSGAIFFSGCTLKCVFCQNYEISTLNKGKTISVLKLSEIFKELENLGADNINLVTPTHFSHLIIKALQIYKPKIPVIYNTHGYESENVIKELSKYVDIFLPDFKYCSSEISQKFSNVNNYFNVALKAIKLMRELKKDSFTQDGKMISGVIIRHMILPLCTNDSIKILETIKKEIPNTKVSLMAQYIPCGKACEIPAINRKITKREYEKVLNKFKELNFDGYVQELESASKEFIPKFKFV